MAERTLVPYTTPTYDLPLVQAAFAEPVLAAEADHSETIRVDLAAATAAALGPPVEPLVEQLAEVAEPPAGEPVAATAAPRAGLPFWSTSSQVRSWVVRELDVSDDDEPVAALTMRILDLRAPVRLDADDIEDEPETAAVGAGWTSFARPA